MVAKLDYADDSLLFCAKSMDLQEAQITELFNNQNNL